MGYQAQPYYYQQTQQPYYYQQGQQQIVQNTNDELFSGSWYEMFTTDTSISKKDLGKVLTFLPNNQIWWLEIKKEDTIESSAKQGTLIRLKNNKQFETQTAKGTMLHEILEYMPNTYIVIKSETKGKRIYWIAARDPIEFSKTKAYNQLFLVYKQIFQHGKSYDINIYSTVKVNGIEVIYSE